MTLTRRFLAVTISTVVILTIAFASPALAFIPCEDCSSPSNCRCAGFCNGQLISTCFDWFYYGCGSGMTADPVDSLFTPAFLLPVIEERNFTPADGHLALEPSE